jgi:hypothetical protein
MAQANLFSDLQTARPPTSKPSSETVWLFAAGSVAFAIDTYVTKSIELKKLEAQVDEQKRILLDAGETRYAAEIARIGKRPPTPLRLRNEAGASVTFSVSDRSATTDLRPDVLTRLEQVLGVSDLSSIVQTRVEFTFDAGVLAQPVADGSTQKNGTPVLVSDVVGRAISPVIAKLVKAGKLSPEQAELLIYPKLKRTLVPGVIDDMAELCGRSSEMILQFIRAVGSALTRSLKA